MTVYQQAVNELQTVRDFLRFGESVFREHDIVCGHGYVEPWDEAVAIVLHSLNLAHDCDPRILDARLITQEKQAICQLFKRRAEDKVPTGYLIHEAWFAELPFWINEHVLIPRSPIAELIEAQFQPWLSSDSEHPKILDMCTGSGCIAIACAAHMPNARVVATDISSAALAVAKRNVERHSVTENVQLLQSDVWDAIPPQQFDIIVTNPPYVATDEYASLAKEFMHEPKLGLEIADQGLAIVKRILRGAKPYLARTGVLIVEVGNAQYALADAFPDAPFCWLEFSRGGDGVFLLRYADLENFCGGE